MGLIRTADDLMVLPQDAALRILNPLQVAGCCLWFKADSLNYLADGSALDAWPDISGNANNAAQSNASYRPTLVKNYWNGHSVVRATAANSQFMTIARAASLEPNNISIFSVHINLTGASYNRVVTRPYRTSGWTSPYMSYGLALSFGGTANQIEFVASVGSATLKDAYTSAAWIASQPMICCAIYDGTATMRVYVNNTSQSLTYSTGSSATGNLDNTNQTDLSLFSRGRYSNGEYGNSYLAELLIFNTALSDANRGIVMNYLKKVYGLPY